MYENTIIVFTSENGGLIGHANNPVTNNAPLRLGKGHMYEGGVRVPLIIKAPGLMTSVSELPNISMDLYPTIHMLAGIQIPDQQYLEGMDITSLLEENQSRDLFWHYPHYHTEGARPYSAIRSGDWKLIYFYESGETELYNLKEDIGETNDLLDIALEKADLLTAKLDEWKEKVGAQLPTKNPNYKPYE